MLERFDAETVVRVLAEEPVTGTFLVPTHLRRIFALGDPPSARAARRILHAGERCPEPLKRRALAWLPDALWEFYGSTEGQFTAISPREWLEHPGSVGRARRRRRLEIAEPDADGVGTAGVRRRGGRGAEGAAGAMAARTARRHASPQGRHRGGEPPSDAHGQDRRGPAPGARRMTV